MEVFEQRQLLSATITTVSSADELLAPSSSVAYAPAGSGTDAVPAYDFAVEPAAYQSAAPMMQSAATASALASLIATPLTVPSDFSGLGEFAPTANTDSLAGSYIVPGFGNQTIRLTLEAGDAGFKNQFFTRRSSSSVWTHQFTQNVDQPGAVRDISAIGGETLIWKVIQNGGNGGTVVFLPSADALDQFQTQVPAPTKLRVFLEDKTTGSDNDFNDMIVLFAKATSTINLNDVQGKFFAGLPKASMFLDSLRDTPSTGIRRNGDNDDLNTGANSRDFLQAGTVPNEDDLVRVKIALNYTFAELLASGITISLERTNPELKAWKARTKVETRMSLGFRIVPDQTNASAAYVEIEWATVNIGLISASLKLVASTATPAASRVLDSLVFLPFNGVVAAFVGEFANVPVAGASVAIDSSGGMRAICGKLRDAGFDAYLFDEDDVGTDTAISLHIPTSMTFNPFLAIWDSFYTVKNAVQGYGVTDVGIIGFSHGGGAVDLLAKKLHDEFPAASNGYKLRFTAYIDAVTKGSLLSEKDRPTDSLWHYNVYQGFAGLIPGVRAVIAGADMGTRADENDNVDAIGGLYVPLGVDHCSIPGLTGGLARGIVDNLQVQNRVILRLSSHMAQ